MVSPVALAESAGPRIFTGRLARLQSNTHYTASIITDDKRELRAGTIIRASTIITPVLGPLNCNLTPRIT